MPIMSPVSSLPYGHNTTQVTQERQATQGFKSSFWRLARNATEPHYSGAPYNAIHAKYETQGFTQTQHKQCKKRKQNARFSAQFRTLRCFRIPCIKPCVA